MMDALRLAMWSGPRNISTAMMRAWENRDDCSVIDEPFYAHYLNETGADHPGRDEVIKAGETNWRRVAENLLGPIPQGKKIWYQKHMCHHLLPNMEHEWIYSLTNILLIRDPSEVVSSYLRTRNTVSAEDIGLPQQAKLFANLNARLGRPPIVIDAGDFLQNPAAHLRTLCETLEINFTERMLHWPPGPRASDGIWAPHWYHAVWQSTGFEKPRNTAFELSDSAMLIVEECREIYQNLREYRLQPLSETNELK